MICIETSDLVSFHQNTYNYLFCKCYLESPSQGNEWSWQWCDLKRCYAKNKLWCLRSCSGITTLSSGISKTYQGNVVLASSVPQQRHRRLHYKKRSQAVFLRNFPFQIQEMSCRQNRLSPIRATENHRIFLDINWLLLIPVQALKPSVLITMKWLIDWNLRQKANTGDDPVFFHQVDTHHVAVNPQKCPSDDHTVMTNVNKPILLLISGMQTSNKHEHMCILCEFYLPHVRVHYARLSQ